MVARVCKRQELGICLYLVRPGCFLLGALNDEPSKKDANFATVCIFLLGKFIDTGYGALLLAVLLIVALAAVTMNGMESADRLKFLQGILALPIWAWLGWIVAIGTILISRFLLKQQREIFIRSLKHSDDAKEAVLKQAELRLENTLPPK